VIVKQECFKTIKDFSKTPTFRKGNGTCGVYLWGFSLEESDFTIPTTPRNFFPYYVGKIEDNTKGCMYQRTQEHITSLVGGNLSIFDIKNASAMGTPIGTVHSSYQKASKCAKPSIGPTLPDPPNFPNLLYFPEGVHRYFDFFTTPIIVNQIDWMVKHFCVTYFTPLGDDKQNIVDLEKFIGNIIGYENLNTKPYSISNLTVGIKNNPNDIAIAVNNYDDLFKHCI